MISAIALTGSAAPALADSSRSTETTGTLTVFPANGVDASALSTAVSGAQAAAAVEQTALDLSLEADKESSAAAAKKAAAQAKKAADERAAAQAAKAAAAAKARAAAVQAASRAAERAKLAATATSTANSPSDSSSSSGSSGSSGSSASSAPTAGGSSTTSTATGSAAKLISFLKSQLGKPYVYGATGPDSYDCSGLTQVAFQTVGVSLPRTSQEQSNAGTSVPVGNVQPGDLIFWGGQGSAYHVGVYIGGGQYLDAANSSTPVAIHQMADYMPDWAVRVI